MDDPLRRMFFPFKLCTYTNASLTEFHLSVNILSQTRSVHSSPSYVLSTHDLSNLAFPIGRTLKSIRKRAVIHHSLPNLARIRQNKRPILHNWLIQWQARDENKSRILLGIGGHLCDDLIALLFKDSIMEFLDFLLCGPDIPVHSTFERVCESVPACGEILNKFPTRLNIDIEEPDWSVGQFLHRIDALRAAGNDFDCDLAIVCPGDGDLRRSQVPISRFAGFEIFGQIDPELHANIGGTVAVVMGHFGVDDASASRHELQVTRIDLAFVAGEIFVINSTGEQICNCLLAAVRMVWKAVGALVSL